MRGEKIGGVFPAWRSTVVLLIAAVLLVGGCSGKKGKKSSAGGAAEESAGQMPAVDLGTALVVDDGRIAIASPTGWTRLPRSKDSLVKYQPGPKKSYPKILLIAEDAPAGFAAVTPENHKEFAAGIAAGVEQSLGKTKPLKKPAAVQLGPHLGVAWGIPGSTKVDGLSETIERWLYAVVIGGRMYTIEARAPKGKIDAAGKAAARAVACALAPPQANKPAEPAAPAEPPAEGEPPAAAEQPAAEKPAAADADQ